MEDGIFFGGNHGKQKKQWFIIIVPDVFLDPPNLKHAKIWGQIQTISQHGHGVNHGTGAAAWESHS